MALAVRPVVEAVKGWLGENVAEVVAVVAKAVSRIGHRRLQTPM